MGNLRQEVEGGWHFSGCWLIRSRNRHPEGCTSRAYSRGTREDLLGRGTAWSQARSALALKGRRLRIAAVLGGIALAGGAFALTIDGLLGGDTSPPSRESVPAPTYSRVLWRGPGPRPVLDVRLDDVYRPGCDEADYCAGFGLPFKQITDVADLLMNATDLQLRSPSIGLERPDPARETTRIRYRPGLVSDAKQLRERVFLDAELRVGLPHWYLDDIHVEIGDDFVRRHQFELKALSYVKEFLLQREKGKGAERFISQKVAAHYERGEGGLSLYRYADDYFDEVQMALHEGVVEIAVVPILGELAPMDDAGPVVEIIQVGWVRDARAEGGQRLAIVGVHRDTFRFPTGPQ